MHTHRQSQTHLRFVRSFVDYYEFDPKVADDGEPTDAAVLEGCLPSLKAVIESEDIPTIEPQQGYDKDYLYNAVKLARESVNPNYKYCVVYHDASECGLTDDIGVAMEHAALVSKRRRFDNINVCRIVKSVIPNLDVCGTFCEILDLNVQEKLKLFFN